MIVTYRYDLFSYVPDIGDPHNVKLKWELEDTIRCRNYEDKNGYDQHRLVDLIPQFPTVVCENEPTETMN